MGFWDNASIGHQIWPPKSVGELMGMGFTLTLLCLGTLLDPTPYILPPSCVVTVDCFFPDFSAPLCKRPTSSSGVSFGHTAGRLSPHVLPRVHRGKCPQL